jgi:hypothetical protein
MNWMLAPIAAEGRLPALAAAAGAAGIATKLGNHSFRATGITAPQERRHA